MEQTPKQQIVEKVNQANNVLVTVGKDPSVDELSSALGLSLMLTKLGKHATAVFSGKVPGVMEFLEPEKTLREDVDNLRDFIISLDKEKADKLRYKVEDNVVKIFITPYRTSITKDDFQFSQGDFNVDVVVGLGVQSRDDVDEAIKSHGRILHDAVLISMTCKADTSDFGSVNWHEPEASSLSEMLVSISEAFQGGLLDGQISTALLTGIISATERFSNPATTPKVMTMAAQLMAAGANQQLIANNLEAELAPKGTSKKSKKSDKTELEVKHEDKDDKKEEKPTKDAPVMPDLEADIKAITDSADKPADLPKIDASKAPKDAEFKQPILSELEEASKNLKIEQEARQEINDETSPIMGGTFNATSDQAHEDAQKEKELSINKEILTHDVQPPANTVAPAVQPPVASPIQPQPMQDESAQQTDQIEQARMEVAAAANSAPFNPGNNPLQSMGSVPMDQGQPLQPNQQAGPVAPAQPPAQGFMNQPPQPPVQPQPPQFGGGQLPPPPPPNAAPPQGFNLPQAPNNGQGFMNQPPPAQPPQPPNQPPPFPPNQ